MRCVRQRRQLRGDCGIACVATVTDSPFNHVLAARRAMPRPGLTCTSPVLGQLLVDCGRASRTARFNNNNWRQVLARDALAIVAVDVVDGKYHWIVVFKRKLGMKDVRATTNNEATDARDEWLICDPDPDEGGIWPARYLDPATPAQDRYEICGRVLHHIIQ